MDSKRDMNTRRGLGFYKGPVVAVRIAEGGSKRGGVRRGREPSPGVLANIGVLVDIGVLVNIRVLANKV